MNPRENYLAAARGEKPERVPVFPQDANIFMPPFWHERDAVTGEDMFGIKWVKNDAGEMPDPSHIAMKDIHSWREIIKLPELSELDWEGMAREFYAAADPEKVNICMLNTSGLFLIPVNMMGWVEALCTICEEPEETGALVNFLADFLTELAAYLGKYFHPDIIFTGDDFASAAGPFLSRDTFREIYRPSLMRINNAIHESGALAEFHCCGNCGWLIQEFLDCGADICQLPEPNEKLLEDKARLGNRLVLTGGWDRHGPGSMPGADEETVRESVRLAIDTYGKDGALIFWDGGIVGTGEDSANKMKWVLDEVSVYGNRVYR